jgi:CrcB protein
MANAGHPRSRVEVMREASRLAVIGVGGVLGALSRAGVSQIFGQDRLELGDQSANFPWATLAINVTGAFLIGILAVALITDNSSYRKPFLITGFLGGFTTFSALALEAVDLFDRGLWVTALVYLIVTVGAGLLAVNIGVRATRRVVRT